jgi:hypothetical protein
VAAKRLRRGLDVYSWNKSPIPDPQKAAKANCGPRFNAHRMITSRSEACVTVSPWKTPGTQY